MQDSKAKNSWTNKSFASEISAWTCINAILYIPSALPLSAFCLHGVTSLSLSLSLHHNSRPCLDTEKNRAKRRKKKSRNFEISSLYIFIVCDPKGKKKRTLS